MVDKQAENSAMKIHGKGKCEAEKCCDVGSKGKTHWRNKCETGRGYSGGKRAKIHSLHSSGTVQQAARMTSAPGRVYKAGGARTTVHCHSYQKLEHQTLKPLYNTNYKPNHKRRLEERRLFGTLRIHTETDLFRTLSQQLFTQPS